MKMTKSFNMREEILIKELFRTIYLYRKAKQDFNYIKMSGYTKAQIEAALSVKYTYIPSLMQELRDSLKDSSIIFLSTKDEYFLVNDQEIIYSMPIEKLNKELGAFQDL